MSNVAPTSNLVRTGAITGLAIQPRTLKEQAAKLALLATERHELALTALDEAAATDADEATFLRCVAAANDAQAAREEALYLVQLVAGMTEAEQNERRDLVAVTVK